MAKAGLQSRRETHIRSAFESRTAQANWQVEPFSGLDDARAKAIRAHFAASNERFAQAVWGRPWAEMVPPKTGFSRNELPLDPGPDIAADIAPVVDEMRTLIAQTVARKARV